MLNPQSVDNETWLSRLATTSGEWLRGDGPESDIVISSRVRLARNIAGFPFVSRASGDIRHQIVQLAQDSLNSPGQPSRRFVNVETLSPLDCQFLMERQLISRELARSDGPRGCRHRRRRTAQHHDQ